MPAEMAATVEGREPGAMAVVKTRELPSGYTIEFESAPVGWPKKDGDPRKRDWRAYYLSAEGMDRQRVESVTTICDAILPKDGLPPWSERQGIRGATEAMRRGLLTPSMTDDEAVAVVRSNRLGAVAERDDAADRGLNVHAILEHYMLTGSAPNPAEHPAPHRPFIRGLVRWLIKAEPEPLAVELLVADPERQYAGRLDLLARIDDRIVLVDLKTQERGAIYESAHIQVQLYREAEERFGEHAIDDALIVVVDGTGTPREMELIADSELARKALAFYLPVKRLCSECDSQNRVFRDIYDARKVTEALEAGAA